MRYGGEQAMPSSRKEYTYVHVFSASKLFEQGAVVSRGTQNCMDGVGWSGSLAGE